MSTNALKASPLFQEMSDDALREIVDLGTRRTVDADVVVLRAGQPNDSIFIVLDGSVRVEHATVEEDVELATLGAGVAFGEMSAIELERVGASVRAIAATELLELPRAALDELLEARPAVAAAFWRNVARELTRRLARTNELVEHYVDLNQVLTSSPQYAGLLGGT